MKKYTFISEYKGGTYINQFQGENLYKSLEIWGENLDSSIYSKDDLMQLKRELQMDDYKPISIKTLENVWCCAFLSDDSLLLLNIIETV